MFQIISEVKCPVCSKFKKPHQLKEITNGYYDDVPRGHALITNCCKAIVAKNYWFDYNRGLFREGKEALEKKNWKVLNEVVITDKPEIWRKIKIIQQKQSPRYIEEIVIFDK